MKALILTAQEAKAGERGFEVVEEEKNSTTLPQILDFIFTVTVQCKHCWLDFSAFAGFKAPAPPRAAAHPAVAWRGCRPLFSLM